MQKHAYSEYIEYVVQFVYIVRNVYTYIVHNVNNGHNVHNAVNGDIVLCELDIDWCKLIQPLCMYARLCYLSMPFCVLDMKWHTFT